MGAHGQPVPQKAYPIRKQPSLKNTLRMPWEKPPPSPFTRGQRQSLRKPLATSRQQELKQFGFQGATVVRRYGAAQRAARIRAYQLATGFQAPETANPNPISRSTAGDTGWTPSQLAAAEKIQYETKGLPRMILENAIQGFEPSSLQSILHGHMPTGSEVGLDALFFLPVSRFARAGVEAGLAAKAGEDVGKSFEAARSSFKAGKGVFGGATAVAKRNLIASERILARSPGRKELKTWLFDNLSRAHATAQMHYYDQLLKGVAQHGTPKDLEEAARALRFNTNVAHNAPGDLKGLYQHVMPPEVPAMPDRLHVKGLPHRVYKLIKQGAAYRDWYQRASAVLTREAARVGVTPEQMAGVTAVMSQQANPTFNLRRAIEAIREFKTTGQIDPKRYFAGQADKATQILNGTFDWGGLKTNSYFGNFLEHMNPELHAQMFPHQPVTIDRHMAEMFLGKKNLSEKQYLQVQKIMQDTATKLGWKPSEVQAAAWVPWKANNIRETTQVKALGRELAANGEIPKHLLPTPGMPKKESIKLAKLRAQYTREVFDTGRRAGDFVPGPIGNYFPKAADAYEHGESMQFQRLHREHTFASGVTQVHSEANPDMALHETLRKAYDNLAPADQRMYDRLVNKAVDGQFEDIIGLNRAGFHEGQGVWRGKASEGIASHLDIGTGPVSEADKTKIEALAAAQGIAKHQDSVAWGRPTAVGQGAFHAIHWDPQGKDVANLSGVMDSIAGEGNVGFIHAPDGGFYVVDFAGGNEAAISRLGGHQTPIGWDGHYVTGKPGGDGFGTPYQEAIDKLPPEVRGRLIQKINQVKSQVDQLDSHFLHVPIPQVVDRAGAEALAAQGGHAFHGTTPMNAESIMNERTLRVGGSNPEAAWTTTDPGLADFHARGSEPNIVAIPRHDIPDHKPGAFGVHGAPEDIKFQNEFTHVPTDQLQARLDELNGRYQKVVDELAKEHRPGDYKRVTAYQNARAKKMARKGDKYPTVAEQARMHAEQRLADHIDANPTDPHVQQLMREHGEAWKIQQEINRRNDTFFQGKFQNPSEETKRLFEQGQFKGAYQRTATTQAIIHLSQQADVTTVPHELAHFMADMLGPEDRALAEKIVGPLNTEQAHETFATMFESWIRSGDAPKNLMPEGSVLSKAFKEAYPLKGALPEVPPEMAGLFKKMLNQKDGFTRTAYYLLRNAAVKHSLISGPGHPRTDEQANQHLEELASKLLKRRAPRDLTPEVPRGEITAETGGQMGKDVRDALSGKVDTSGMGTYEAIGAKQELGTSAPAARTEREQMFKTERSKRIARAEAAAENTDLQSGIDRYIAFSHELTGKLPSDAWKNFQGPVKENVSDILHFILDHPLAGTYDKKDAADAIMGGIEHGYAPTKSQEAALRIIFGREMAGGIRDMIKNKEFGRLILEVAAIPRAIMASYDFGAGLRQGIMFGVARPGLFKEVYAKQFKLVFEHNYDALQAAIHSDPYLPIYEKMGIQFTNVGAQNLSQREEYFASTLAERLIPGIKQSDRLYTGFLNMARWQYAKAMLEMGSKIGYDMGDEKLLKDLGEYINAATGRGPLKRLEAAAPVLNATLFSPRLLASRIAFINPFWYIQMHPLARQEALRAARNFMTMVSMFGGLAYLAGAKVNLNPTNADFAKIRIGNTRIDPTAGFTQEARLMAQMISGEVTSSITGRTEKLSGKAFGVSRLDILQRWLRTKANPITGITWDMLKGSNTLGQPLHWNFNPFDNQSELANYFTPLVIQDFINTFQQHGNIGAGIGALAASEAGVGIQTYGTPLKTASEAEKKLISDSHAAGIGDPPAVVKDEIQWQNRLDNATYAGESSYDKAKTAAKLYDERFGTTRAELMLSHAHTEGQAEKLYQIIRAHIAPHLSMWNTRINRAKRRQQEMQPVPSSAPAPPAQGASATPAAPAMQETAYHVPAQGNAPAGQHVPVDAGNQPTSGGVHARFLAAHPSAPQGAATHIAAAAAQRGLDPQAVLAVASQEGLGGGVGDSGTSFGPFQLHAGGALPSEVWAKGPQYAAAWAWSPEGINYALDRMASVARGLKGQAAVQAIVAHFERPANIPGEVSGAMAAYGQPVSDAAQGLRMGDGIPASPAGNLGGGLGGGMTEDQVLNQGLSDLASGHYNPSVQIMHLFRAAASTPLKTSIGGIHFEIPKGGLGKTARGALALAQQYLGVKYTYGGESPATGFDCSGLLQYVWSHQGVNIPRTSQQQFDTGMPVSRNALQPGDAVFFVGGDGTRSAPGHVGMYIGHGLFIEAPHTGATVRVSRLAGYPGYVGARRFVGTKA